MVARRSTGLQSTAIGAGLQWYSETRHSTSSLPGSQFLSCCQSTVRDISDTGRQREVHLARQRSELHQMPRHDQGLLTQTATAPLARAQQKGCPQWERTYSTSTSGLLPSLPVAGTVSRQLPTDITSWRDSAHCTISGSGLHVQVPDPQALAAASNTTMTNFWCCNNGLYGPGAVDKETLQYVVAREVVSY